MVPERLLLPRPIHTPAAHTSLAERLPSPRLARLAIPRSAQAEPAMIFPSTEEHWPTTLRVDGPQRATSVSAVAAGNSFCLRRRQSTAWGVGRAASLSKDRKSGEKGKSARL